MAAKGGGTRDFDLDFAYEVEIAKETVAATAPLRHFCSSIFVFPFSAGGFFKQSLA